MNCPWSRSEGDRTIARPGDTRGAVDDRGSQVAPFRASIRLDVDEVDAPAEAGGQAAPAISSRAVRTSGVLEARPPDTDIYVPDTVIDTGTVGGLIYRAICSRGVAKRMTPSPRQDQMAISLLCGGGIGFALSDGVSEAPQSHIGAALAVRYGLKALDRSVPWTERIDLVNWALVQEHARAEGISDDGVELATVRSQLATTLVLARMKETPSGWLLEAGLVGDSALLLLIDGQLRDPLPAPDCGAPNVTDALPGPSDVTRYCRMTLGPSTVVILASDGVARPLMAYLDPARLFERRPDHVGSTDWLTKLRDPLGDDQTLIAIWVPAGGTEVGERRVHTGSGR